MANKELEDLQLRIMQASKFVEGWHTNIDKWRKYYNSNHYDDQPRPKPVETRYSDPTFTNTVDLSVGIMLGNNLRWHSFGFAPSSEEQEDTGMVEKLIEGVLFVSNLREQKHLLYELFLNFNRDGGGVLYTVVDPAIARKAKTTIEVPDNESQTGVVSKTKYKEVPVRVQVIDPKKFFALPGGPRRWLLVGREEDMTVFDIEARYQVKLPDYVGMSDMEKSSILTTIQDVWDYVKKGDELLVRNTIMCGGRAIKGPTIMEGYSDLPYTFQFFKPTGEKSSEWHNIMTPLESPLKLLESSVNRRAHQIDIYTGLPIVSKTQPGRVVQVDPGLFNHVNLSPEESIEFPAWPGNAPDVMQHQEFLRSRVQQSGFSDIMFGSGQSQVAGFALSQLGDQNRIRLEQPIKHLELLLSSWARKTIDMLSVFFPEDFICVYGKYRGKNYNEYVVMEEIKDYAVVAEIRPKFPAEESRKVAMATQAKGILSNYTILERFFDVEQPEDEEKRQMIEAATNHPVTVQYTIIAELKNRAEEGDEVAAMTLQAMLQGGLPGLAGRPKDPNNPEQLTGTQSPTGQPVPQAQGQEVAGRSAEDQMDNMANAAPDMQGGVGGY